MASTRQFELPLLASAQAQKHVTVNDALARLDAVTQMRVVSAALLTPPAAPEEGEAYLVPDGAADAWTGQDGHVAVSVNGAWVFLAPRVGWRLWNESASEWYLFSGTTWIAGGLAVSAGGAATLSRIVEIDHTVAVGASSTAVGAIPSHAQVVGLTGRVTSEITGSASTWRIGVPGSDNRYGAGLGTAKDSFVQGLSSAPVTYYGATDVVLTGEGGSFTGGAVRLALHLVELRVPDAI